MSGVSCINGSENCWGRICSPHHCSIFHIGGLALGIILMLSAVIGCCTGLGHIGSIVLGVSGACLFSLPLAHCLKNICCAKKQIERPIERQLEPAERLEAAITTLQLCPQAKALLEKLKAKNPPLSIIRVPREMAVSGAMANINSQIREICIAEDATQEEMIFRLLWELINMEGIEGDIEHFNFNKYSTARAYALALEEFEYETAKKSYKILEQAITDGYWLEECLFAHPFHPLSPEMVTIEWCLEAQEAGGHTLAYEIFWYKVREPENFNSWYEKRSSDLVKKYPHLASMILEWKSMYDLRTVRNLVKRVAADFPPN